MKVILILALTVLFFSFPNVVGQTDSQDPYIVIKPPPYIIEKSSTELKVYVVNKGNHSFNGTFEVSMRQRPHTQWLGNTTYIITDLEGGSHQEFIYNLVPHNGAGVYTLDAKLFNKEGRFVKTYSDNIIVKSYENAVGILAGIGGIIVMLIVVYGFFSKRK